MIAFVASNLTALNGIAQASRSILTSLLAINHPILILTNKKCQLPSKLYGSNLSIPSWYINPDIISFFEDILPTKVLQNVTRRIFNLRFKKSLNQKINDSLDLLIVQGLNSHRYYENHFLRLNAKKAIIVHESPRHFISNRNYSLKWTIEVLTKYDYLIFVSSNCQNEWLSYDELNGKISFYIPNTCDEDSIQKLFNNSKYEIRTKLKISNNKFMVACVASIQPRKNQEIIINTLPKIIKKYPNIHIYFIGPKAIDYKWADKIVEKIKNDEFSTNMTYLGARQDAKEYIYASDLLILPSLAEAMPIVILEAMALKTPVIASNVDGISELIDNDKSGLLFSPLELDSFVEAFTHILSNPSKAMQYSNNAFEKYWSCFSINNQIRKYNEFLKEVLRVFKGSSNSK